MREESMLTSSERAAGGSAAGWPGFRGPAPTFEVTAEGAHPAVPASAAFAVPGAQVVIAVERTGGKATRVRCRDRYLAGLPTPDGLR
jgi:hypothetical protein